MDPLLLVSFVCYHDNIIKKISDKSLDLNAWFLDDGTIAGHKQQVLKALSIIQKHGPDLHLNLKFTKVPAANEHKQLFDEIPEFVILKYHIHSRSVVPSVRCLLHQDNPPSQICKATKLFDKMLGLRNTSDPF